MSTSDATGPSVEWCANNEFHDDLWKLLHLPNGKIAVSLHSIKSHKKQNGKNKKTINIDQAKFKNKNEVRIQSINETNILSTNELTAIIDDPQCTLITILNVPNGIIQNIVSFAGYAIIPISYSLSCLPFVDISVHTQFDGSLSQTEWWNKLEKWWNEVRLSSNHRGLFYPNTLQRAAHEFNDFIGQHLDSNGERTIMYRWYTTTMVPTISVEINKCFDDLEINDTSANIVLSLPTSLSANEGGIELFERLYLESVIDPECIALNIDITDINEQHNDGFCFDGEGFVLMANGGYKKVCNVAIGDHVECFPNRVGTVKCVVVTKVNDRIKMVKLPNEGWITFEHPILMSESDEFDINEYECLTQLNSFDINKYGLYWTLPKDVFPIYLKYQDNIYNFILDKHHTLNVNGNWCVTLGHDFEGDVIQHDFWGNSVVIKSFLISKSSSYPNVFL